MADYTDVHSTYAMRFYPDKGPHYFYSGKSFTESSTTVPEDYYDFLVFLFEDFVKRNYKNAPMVPRAKITWNGEKREWTLHGFALSMDGRKVEERFGWENPCEHDYRKSPHRDYEFCLRCHDIKCDHKIQNQEKVDGVIDHRWVCNACGKIVEEPKPEPKKWLDYKDCPYTKRGHQGVVCFQEGDMCPKCGWEL